MSTLELPAEVHVPMQASRDLVRDLEIDASRLGTPDYAVDVPLEDMPEALREAAGADSETAGAKIHFTVNDVIRGHGSETDPSIELPKGTVHTFGVGAALYAVALLRNGPEISRVDTKHKPGTFKSAEEMHPPVADEEVLGLRGLINWRSTKS